MLFFHHYLVLGDNASPNLRDVLVFLTGSDSIPPVGFGLGGTIDFTDIDQLQTSSTCSLTLTLSRKMSTNYMQFKEVMDLSVIGSKDFFGQP